MASSSSFAIRKGNSIIQAGEKPHQKKKSNKPIAGSVSSSIQPRTYLLCETRVVQAPVVPNNGVVESSPERKQSLDGSAAEKLNNHSNFRFGGVAYHRAGQFTTAPSSSSSRAVDTALSIQNRPTSLSGKENHTKLAREHQSVPLQWRESSHKFPPGCTHGWPPSSSSSETISQHKSTATSSSGSHHTSLHRHPSKSTVVPKVTHPINSTA